MNSDPRPLSLFEPLEGEKSPPQLSQPTLAPMLQSYMEMKRRFKNHILLYQVGDFYEIFFEDARRAADCLSIRLTSRDKNSLDPIPMCGVPIHALDSYLPRLLAAGHSVAIVSQVEGGGKSKASVRRELTRIVTPGVRLEGDGLVERDHNFCAAVVMLPEGGAISAIDCSTGYVKVYECETAEELRDTLEQLRAREVLLPTTLYDRPVDSREKWYRAVREVSRGVAITERAFSEREDLLRKIPASSTNLSRPVKLALATILSYAEEISCGRLTPIGMFTQEDRRSVSLIDAATARNLELTETRIDGERKNSLLSHIDYTCTAMGARLLSDWIVTPRATLEQARQRQEAVSELINDTVLLERMQGLLREIRDLERIISRIAAGRGVPKDFGVLRDSIALVPHLKLLLGSFSATLLRSLRAEIPDLCGLEQLLAEALTEEPPVKLNEGEIFREGFHQELDRLRELRRDAGKALLQMEQQERERTGIPSLKIRFNNVFGYSIEISKTNLGKIPANYERRQTLANAERFITPELKAFEVELLGAKDRASELERELFEELKQKVLEHVSAVQQVGQALSIVDVLCSFAELAWRHNYCRPELTEGLELEIEEGRHPVVERVIGFQNFVGNEARMDGELRRFAVLTGPNMGGKSTYLRQIGLIQLLAQAGSFVPAKRAKLGFVDRIFTRIGAADDLSRGDSTFMVEMRETAAILRRASQRSLVLIDEIGRGTATVDGRAIATAVADELLETIRCRTIFATHFHELTALSERQGVFCLTVGVLEEGDEIHFTHRILEQIGDRSYGIEVARLAGLPPEVLEKALIYFSRSDGGEEIDLSKKIEIVRGPNEGAKILERLREINPESITPLEALVLLSNIRKELN